MAGSRALLLNRNQHADEPILGLHNEGLEKVASDRSKMTRYFCRWSFPVVVIRVRAAITMLQVCSGRSSDDTIISRLISRP